MATRLKGKWAQGIQPRNFSWVIKDKLAICERPGGYAANHRRVRRQEEIIWIREQGFGCVVSLIPTPHNLHNYEELGVHYLHRPFSPIDDPREFLGKLYPELHAMLIGGMKVIMHIEEVSDRLGGVVGGYIRWSGMVSDAPSAIAVTEKLTSRQLEPLARSFIALAVEL